MSRRLLTLAVVMAVIPVSGCAPMSKSVEGGTPISIDFEVAADHASGGGLHVAYTVVNRSEGDLLFREQRNPFVIFGPGGAVQISVRRESPPPGTTVVNPGETNPVRVVARGEKVTAELFLPLPLAEHLPTFPSPEGWPGPESGATFCLGISTVRVASLRSPATDGRSRASALDFDDSFFCQSIPTAALTPSPASFEPVS
jgi:hypothetical protein